MAMYPPSRAARFFVVIGFSFFVLLLHSIDKRQTYARLELIHVHSGWHHNVNADSDQDTNKSSLERGGQEFTRVHACEQSYGVQFQTDSEYVSQKIFENLNLNSESFVIEVGGFEGDWMLRMFKLYEIGFYAVLEPVWTFFNILMRESDYLPQGKIKPLNIGLGAKDDIINVKMIDDRTSVYNRQTESRQSESWQSESRNTSEPTTDLYIVGVERFFRDIGIGMSDDGFKGHLDLLILDCEGCEYDVLDYLLRTPKVLHFIHIIMFRSHRFKGHEQEMIRKYCTYQELLPLTHDLRFQQKFSWDVWTLRKMM
ncbi:uncharacterized protein LOC110458022 [Mizuhopecten yessoensis]|uniref:Methyltransferase FkbM domain-containing protein n=1 Tax=Mizuhopecten yessoensis TaxID=6573 RepID=A0A210Q7G6_MIZYE|nr:uncharacterized protein LOC110458022 [Mizuhopecten yessoensis]OWF44686.1 hypothetical protein KP79_PYT24028 [Mizuhopecten yessoensis]